LIVTCEAADARAAIQVEDEGTTAWDVGMGVFHGLESEYQRPDDDGGENSSDAG
jgi:hypothetical protein